MFTYYTKFTKIQKIKFGGTDGNRTHYHNIANVVFYLLNYNP